MRASARIRPAARGWPRGRSSDTVLKLQSALNVFTLFTGMGLGSLAFQALLLPTGFGVALSIFGAAVLLAAAVAVPVFRHERPRTSTHAA